MRWTWLCIGCARKWPPLGPLSKSPTCEGMGMRWPLRSLRPSLLASMLMAATVSLLAVTVLVFAAVMTVTYLQPSLIGRRGLTETTQRVADAIRFDASGEPVSGALSPTLTRPFDALHSDVFYRIVGRPGQALLTSDG